MRLAQVLEIGVGEGASNPAPAQVLTGNTRQAGRIVHRQWPEEGKIRNPENQRTGANAQCGREYGNRGEARLPAEGSDGINAVLPEVAQPACDPGSARFFLLQRSVAKLALSGAARILVGHAVLHQFPDLHLQVDFHLFPQEAGAFAAVRPIAEPPLPSPQHYASPMTRAMAAVISR